jgi:outer membrane protein assembly factor BamB
MFFRLLDENKDGLIKAEEWPRIHTWMEPWKHANGLIALRPTSDGSPPALAWQHEVGVPECPTPIVANGNVYAVRNGGVVTCLDARTGTQLFQDRLASGGPYYASPVGSSDAIYLASARGTITVLSAEKTPRVLNTLDLGEHVWATPAISGQYIIIRGEKHLWMFGPG